ncbi:MAG TPA: glycosyltransferase family 39 protein [Chitinophagaceae bacterium]|nr:glycosyltransferase family 39 protein [Chitinophagaceae bacterium]
MAYSKRLALLIITCTIVRILLAFSVELGNDEVYYYTYALHLQSSYFDHPLGVALLIRLFTFNLTFNTEIFIRAGAIICAAAATWLCFAIGTIVRNQRTGWIAAILYNTSLYSGVIAGTFILPDSPQVVCWLAAIYVLLRLVKLTQDNRRAYLYWMLFGLLAGCCIMCKVHGVFLWAGLVLYIVLFNRRIFLQPGLYIALVLTAVIASPILFWNVHNNFITWRYHSNRVAVSSMAIHPAEFFQALAGQVFYNNPVNVIVITGGIIYCYRKPLLTKKATQLLLCTGIPIIACVSGIALWRDVLPHWSGPGFITLSFFGAAWTDALLFTKKRAARLLLNTAITLIITIVAGGAAFINFYPGTIGNSKAEKYGEDDFTLDMYGWKDFGVNFLQWKTSAEAGKLIMPGLPVVCNKWFPAAHIDFYVARPAGTKVAGVGVLDDLHHFAWLNRYRNLLPKGSDALCIVPSNYPLPVESFYRHYFDQVILLKKFTEYRNGHAARFFTVYLLKHYNATDEVAGMKIR